MKNYQKIQPEVIVGLGEKTQFLEKAPPFRTVTNLHIQLEDWLGDDLMECHPCFLVTESLKKGLESSYFTGFEFENLEVTKDEYFNDNYKLDKTLPKFYWLKVKGHETTDDITLDIDSVLNVSDELLLFLQKNYTLNYMDINPERNEFDDLLDQMIADSKKSEE